MDARGQRADLPVGQHAGVVRVDFVENLRYVELLHGAHQKVEIREGELHVLRMTHAMQGGLIKLLRKAEGAKPTNYSCSACRLR